MAVAVLCLAALRVLHGEPSDQAITLDVVVDQARLRGALTAHDFSVTENGQPLSIEGARLVQPSLEATALPEIVTDADEVTAAAVAQRVVGIYIDEYHLKPDGFAAARAAVAAFIRHQLGPGDLVVVLKPLDSLVSIRMTSDRERAAAVVEGATPRQGDYSARSTFEQEFIAGAPARIDAARRQITLSAVSAMAAHLGRFPTGRKTLLVVSNGLPLRVASAPHEQLTPGIESIARAANRGRVAIYALRPSPQLGAPAPRAMTRSSLSASDDALDALAEQTTGTVIDGDDAAASGLQRVLRDASHYYLLTLAPRDLAPDGRFREVSVASRRPGVTVRARAGYVAPGPPPAASPPSSLPAGLRVPRRTSTLIRTWFGQSAADDGRTRVEFVWEPAPLVPTAPGGALVPARVSIAVTTMDGAPVFSGESGPSGRGAAALTRVRPQLSFAATAGSLLVQMDVLDAAGRVLDRDVRDLAVGGVGGALRFGTAVVYRARTARDVRAILTGDAAMAPVASRQFSRAEHLVVRMPVASREGQPTVTVRLSRFGNVLRELPVTRIVASDSIQVDLPLAGLASGGYTLEFAGRSGSSSASNRLEFLVTP